MRTLRLLPLLAVAALTWPATVAFTQNLPPGLVAVAEYGAEEVNVPGVRATAWEQQRGAAMLARVKDVAESADGRVYVLDAEMFKVVVFAADGRFLRLFGRGEGEGPGEFKAPTALSVLSNGRVAVLDGRLGRITIFDSLGGVSRTVPVAVSQAVDLSSRGDNFLVLRALLPPGRPSLVEIDSAGRIVSEGLSVGPADAEHGRTGSARKFIRMPDTSLALIHPNPGIIERLQGGALTNFSRPLFPTNRVRALPPGRSFVLENSVSGAVIRPTGESLWLIQSWDPVSFTDRSQATAVAKIIVRALGRADRTIQLTEQFAPFLKSAASNGDFFLVRIDPFPQVVRVRIR